MALCRSSSRSLRGRSRRPAARTRSRCAPSRRTAGACRPRRRGAGTCACASPAWLGRRILPALAVRVVVGGRVAVAAERPRDVHARRPRREARVAGHRRTRPYGAGDADPSHHRRHLRRSRRCGEERRARGDVGEHVQLARRELARVPHERRCAVVPDDQRTARVAVPDAAAVRRGGADRLQVAVGVQARGSRAGRAGRGAAGTGARSPRSSPGARESPNPKLLTVSPGCGRALASGRAGTFSGAFVSTRAVSRWLTSSTRLPICGRPDARDRHDRPAPVEQVVGPDAEAEVRHVDHVHAVARGQHEPRPDHRRAAAEGEPRCDLGGLEVLVERDHRRDPRRVGE